MRRIKKLGMTFTSLAMCVCLCAVPVQAKGVDESSQPMVVENIETPELIETPDISEVPSETPSENVESPEETDIPEKIVSPEEIENPDTPAEVDNSEETEITDDIETTYDVDDTEEFEPDEEELLNADGDVPLDENHFPDEIFRNYLKENFDGSKDGILSKEEIEAVTVIEVENKGITDLKGVENFINLQQLKCAGNSLTGLDVTKLTELHVLDCGNNRIAELNLSNNAKLWSVYADNNLIERFSVTKASGMQYLDISQNSLQTLNLNDYPSLYYLDCSDNTITSLTLTNCIKLENLLCNNNQIKKLDLKTNRLLKNIECTGNEKLTAIDITNCSVLEGLYCSKCGVLGNLNLAGCTALQALYANDDAFFTLDLSHNTELEVLSLEGNQLTALNIGGNTKLTELRCSSNRLMSLDTSTNTALSQLICNNNLLTALDLKNNTNLTELQCSVNKITSLDFSSCQALSLVSCDNNLMKQVDLANCSQLSRFDCQGNSIEVLDIRTQAILLNTYLKGNKTVKGSSREYTYEGCRLTLNINTRVISSNDVTVVFDDVKEGKWYVGAVQYVYDNNIMSGKGYSFKPDESLSREEFVRVLYNNSGTPEPTIANPFADVKTGQWYTKAVLWSKEKGIANGKVKDGKTVFGIGDSISREEMAVMLYKYAQMKGYDTTKNDTAIQGYADTKNVSTWAKDAMNWAVTQGIMSGKGNNVPKWQMKLDPQGRAARAECASMMKKMIEKNN